MDGWKSSASRLDSTAGCCGFRYVSSLRDVEQFDAVFEQTFGFIF